jgi:Tfp pilus assembly protein PilO
MQNNSKKGNKVSYVVIFTSVFIGVWLLVYFFVGRPILKYSDGLKAEFGSKQTKLQESQELVRSLPDPQKAIADIKEKFQEFQELGVSKKQIPRLMQLLGQTASDHQITVLSLRPREDIKNDESDMPQGINKIYLEITLICSYQVLADFIKAVGELPTAFKVESFTVEKNSETLAPADVKSGSKKPDTASGLLKVVLLLSTISG